MEKSEKYGRFFPDKPYICASFHPLQCQGTTLTKESTI